MNRYKKLKKLGQGAHGTVYLYEYIGEEAAVSSSDDSPLNIKYTPNRPKQHSTLKCGDKVAIKHIKLKDYKLGLSYDCIRELNILQDLPSNPFILSILDVFLDQEDTICIVLEYIETDLEQLINDKQIILQMNEIKNILLMLLQSIEHLHSNYVLHRDIKPTNILVSKHSRDYTIRLADFGLARSFACINRGLSPQSCTLWYRAPELLFGSDSYGPSSDIWSVGCVFAQLLLRAPLFPGSSELDQLSRIVSVLGNPTAWPGIDTLPNYLTFSEINPTPFSTLFPAASKHALDLLQSMLTYNPHDRISAANALSHPFFA